ncbi:MAG: acyl-ACP thioesterase [Tissierellia bacterium]|nr:acyl-ACP thioesterase [Tissierellia bacterium]
MSKFRKSFEISYYETDKNKNLKPTSLLNLLGEIAGEHSSTIVKIDRLEALNYAWMLHRWKVRIDRYPKAKEKIIIETWSSSIDRFYANREFFIYDEKEEVIGKASTFWIFVDIKKKRPIRIPEELQLGYKEIDERAFDEFYDFKEKINIVDHLDFHVRRSDIDYNNHVNNTVYLDWMVEAVPEEIYDNYLLREFEILYKKEIKYGNTILSGINEINVNKHNKVFFHNIVHKETEASHALGITIWEK